MAEKSSSVQKDQANFPDLPKRGKIKAQIFNGLVKSVVSTVSKARESLRKVTGDGGSVSSTPPTSAYNSDGSRS